MTDTNSGVDGERAATVIADGGESQRLHATPSPQAAQQALADADRRAGAAERALAACKEDVARFERVRDQMKDQWGADRRVSFDVVWAEALALKAAQQAPAGADDFQPLHNLLYTAQITTGETQRMAINAARVELSNLRNSAARPDTAPLSIEQIEAMPVWSKFVGLWPETRQEIVRAVEAMLAAPAAPSTPASGGWMPIETAPKDGTEILLFAPPQEYEGKPIEARKTYGKWLAPSDTPHINYQDGFAPEPEFDEFDAHWSTWDGGFTEENPPTHWMPMPASPTIEGESNG